MKKIIIGLLIGVCISVSPLGNNRVVTFISNLLMGVH
jgi:hypothetical protein